VEILYFAWVRERIGANIERIDPPAHVQDVSGLIDWLAGRSPAHAAALGDKSRLRAAIDQRFVGLEAGIAGAREIAIFPPVTGG
jgi:molybdopterin synthase sulfur carrier subunit